MARLARFAIAGVPQHVIHRGNNRTTVFHSDADRLRFLDFLKQAATGQQCAVHAYVLMGNHFHAILTGTRDDSVSKTMQSLGRRYVRYFNDTHERTGSLWEGRFRATPIDSERYLLTCMRYIELNPVRAKIIATPADYKWSSYRHHALGIDDELLSEHPIYRALGPDRGTRQTGYRALFEQALDAQLVGEIRTATNRGWVLGSNRFKAKIAAETGRHVAPKPRGRPPKKVISGCE